MADEAKAPVGEGSMSKESGTRMILYFSCFTLLCRNCCVFIYVDF